MGILWGLPNLKDLDTQYIESKLRPHVPVPGQQAFPKLQTLRIWPDPEDTVNPTELWTWIMTLVRSGGRQLESFCLDERKRRLAIPFLKANIRDLALSIDSLKKLLIGDTLIALDNVTLISESFPMLEELAITVTKVHIVRLIYNCVRLR